MSQLALHNRIFCGLAGSIFVDAVTSAIDSSGATATLWGGLAQLPGAMTSPITFGGETVKLTPRETTLPELKATGRKGLLHTLEWTDPTGARQRLELLDPKSPVTLSPATFKFQVPANTRWSTPNG